MCLATDACLTADPGVASSILAWSHTFMGIEHEIIIPLQTLFVGVYCFHVVRASVRPSVRPFVRPCVRPSVTLCFLNNSKSHSWIFIKPC